MQFLRTTLKTINSIIIMLQCDVVNINKPCTTLPQKINRNYIALFNYYIRRYQYCISPTS